MARQAELPFKQHGGRRARAGRKPVGRQAGVPHRERLGFDPRHPVLVSLKVAADVWNLRWRRTFRVVRGAIGRTNLAGKIGIVEFSVQGNHLHLMVEADDQDALSRGLQGLEVRVAKALNKLMGRKGKVFVDRFHSRVLKSPRQVRNALAYVLGNARKHGLARNVSRLWADPCSSAPWFKGWRRRVHTPQGPPPFTVEARTWLLAEGWRRHGLLDPGFVPG